MSTYNICFHREIIISYGYPLLFRAMIICTKWSNLWHTVWRCSKTGCKEFFFVFVFQKKQTKKTKKTCHGDSSVTEKHLGKAILKRTFHGKIRRKYQFLSKHYIKWDQIHEKTMWYLVNSRVPTTCFCGEIRKISKL